MDEYEKIGQTISPLVGEAGVSFEVFSDEFSTRLPANRPRMKTLIWNNRGRRLIYSTGLHARTLRNSLLITAQLSPVQHERD